MGHGIEFNWTLKLKPQNGLKEKDIEVGRIFEFSKRGNRIYPLNLPIDLINSNWEAIAKVMIFEIKNSQGKTSGKYKVLKVYEDEEKDILTNYWRENVKIITGKDISDFSNVKVS